MSNSIEDSEMRVFFDRFITSFVENRDPRIDLEITALKQLKGSYLEKAKESILERLEKSPGSDPMIAARAVNLKEAIPILQRWLKEIRNNPEHKYRWTSVQGELAYTLHGFTNDISYIPDVVEFVKNEGYGEFTSSVYMLRNMPLTIEGTEAVWQRYKRGKRIKYPYSWKDSCISYLREKMKDPVMDSFLSSLPEDERKEFLELISNNSSLSLKHRALLASRGSEFTSIGDSPVKGLNLKHVWTGHVDYINKLAWSKDGKFLLSNSNQYSREDNSTRIWSMELGSQFKVMQRKGENNYSRYLPLAATWLGNENKIIIAYEHRGIKDNTSVFIWDPEKDALTTLIYEMKDRKPIKDFVCFPDGKKLILSFWYRDEVLSIDIDSRSAKRIFQELTGRYETMALSQDGGKIAIGYHELLDPNTGIEYSPSLIYGKGVTPEVLIYKEDLKTVIQRINTEHLRTGNSLCINRLSWMPGQSILAVASADNTISIWNVLTSERIALLEGHVGNVMDLSFSADGKLLASKSDEDNSLRIWRTDTWQTIARLREPNTHGHVLAFHPSLPILATLCDYGKSIRIWEFHYEDFFSNPPIIEEF